ncbi:4Fe-4S ferredoxin [Puteibacter caeruleilacunae]|nr:4Fe-4S ferredoxin [Puteibacter caeruleilacunae]
MKRQIVKIDEDLCNGCGVCIPNCHEGALQIIDNKARLVSDLMCDGLGACIGHCPLGAITLEEREAEPYNETAVIKEMVAKGRNTVIAHLKHLKDHNEIGFLREGVTYLRENAASIEFDVNEVFQEVHAHGKPKATPQQSVLIHQAPSGGGCPGSQSMSFNQPSTPTPVAAEPVEQQSELKHWPVQMHLINPMANHFVGSDFVLAADCVAFSLGNFHSKFLKGKTLGIACPKLDSNKEMYVNKIQMLIDESKINTLNVLIMEVPCCGGLLQIAQQAVDQAARKIPVKLTIVGIKGNIIQEEWV